MKGYFVLLLGFVASSSALRCWQCENVANFEQCENSGKETECSSDQDVCHVTIRKENGLQMIFAGCKQGNACRNQMKQNDRRDYFDEPKCNSSRPMSLCTCCCQRDLCNQGYSECVARKFGRDVITNFGDVPKCTKLELSQGISSCTNENHVNSICRFSCKDNYHIFPHESEEMTCLPSGQWSEESPCCARIVCEDYPLFDVYYLAHSSSQRTYQDIYSLLVALLINLPLNATHGVQYALLDFGEKVHENDVIDFKEANLQNHRPEAPFEHNTTDSYANVGEALDWIYNNLRGEEVGERKNATNIIIISTDWVTPEDDVITPSKRWRDDGSLIYFIEFSNDEGRSIDNNKIIDIVHEHGHVMKYENNPEELSSKIAHELSDHLCINSC